MLLQNTYNRVLKIHVHLATYMRGCIMSDHYYDHLNQVYVLWKDSRLSDKK
jgi:hypothetical protein